jgi:hypothetical protein
MSEPKGTYNAGNTALKYCARCGLPKDMPRLLNPFGTLATKLCTCPPEPAPVKQTPTLTVLDLAVILDVMAIAVHTNDSRYHYTARQQGETCDAVVQLAASLNAKIELEAQDDKSSPD